MPEFSALTGEVARWILYFVAALFPLVLIHELGHFVLAKLGSVRVEEFGIGFPPRVARLARIGDTEYTVNALPLGGFVRLAGEEDPDVPGAFAARSKRARTAVLLAGPGANFLFAAAVFAAVAYTGPVASQIPGIVGATVLDVSPGRPAAAAGLRMWDIIVSTDGVPLSERATVRKPNPDVGETHAVIALQEATDAARGRPMKLTVLRGVRKGPRLTGSDEVRTRPSELPGVEAREVLSAPEASGLAPGMLIVTPGSDDTSSAPPSAPGGLSGLAHRVLGLGARAGGDGPAPTSLIVTEVVELSVVPEYVPELDVGQVGIAIGTPAIESRLEPVPAAWHGIKTTGLMTVAMLGALGDMLVGERSADIRGPLGIGDLSRDAGERGLDAFLRFMAILSINLGILNLFPIPALDGGRLLFIGAEAIRGRRIEPSREALLHLIGFALVIGLMALLTVKDVLRIVQ